jgi:hypothetical protein
MTQTQAVKKTEVALDKLIDLKDEGYGCDLLERAIELIQTLNIRISDGQIKPAKVSK